MAARTLSAALVGTFAALLAAASPAASGTYEIGNCGASYGPGDWRVTRLDAGSGSFSTACPLSISLRATTHASNDYMELRLRAPADTEIQDYVIERSARVGSGYSYRFNEVPRTGARVQSDRCVASEGCTTKSGSVSGSARELAGLDLGVYCSAASGTTCPAAFPAGEVVLQRAWVRLVDRLAPALTSVTGPLVSAAVAPGVQELTVTASDRGGGVYQVALEVDGRTGEWTTFCHRPFSSAQPCPLVASAKLTVDTRTLTKDAVPVRVLVKDAALNTGSSQTMTLRVANGPLPRPQPGLPADASCNAEPAVTTLALSAGFGSRVRPARTARYGGRVTANGRLVTPLGAPVPGAGVCVLLRDALPGAAPLFGGILLTDGDGRFSYALPAGPSRTVTFIHRTGAGAVSATVNASVRAPVTLSRSRRSLRNGEVVVLSGRLGGRPIPDTLVEIQAARRGGWQTFRTRRTDSRGRFRLRYRFTRTLGVQRYRLRARVPKQPGLPFATGTSSVKVVRVRG